MLKRLIISVICLLSCGQIISQNWKYPATLIAPRYSSEYWEENFYLSQNCPYPIIGVEYTTTPRPLIDKFVSPYVYWFYQKINAIEQRPKIKKMVAVEDNYKFYYSDSVALWLSFDEKIDSIYNVRQHFGIKEAHVSKSYFFYDENNRLSRVLTQNGEITRVGVLPQTPFVVEQQQEFRIAYFGKDMFWDSIKITVNTEERSLLQYNISYSYDSLGKLYSECFMLKNDTISFAMYQHISSKKEQSAITIKEFYRYMSMPVFIRKFQYGEKGNIVYYEIEQVGEDTTKKVQYSFNRNGMLVEENGILKLKVIQEERMLPKKETFQNGSMSNERYYYYEYYNE